MCSSDLQTYSFSPKASCILNDSLYMASSTGLYQQVQNQSYDGIGSPIKSTIKTTWINMNQVDGFGRLYAIFIYGSNPQNYSTLKAKLYYDFEEYPSELISITPYNLSTATTWGSDATWGSGSNWGGTYDGSYNFVIRPKRQKCSAVRIELYDEFPNGNTSQSFNFSGISLAVGIKPTWNKDLSYTKRLT